MRILILGGGGMLGHRLWLALSRAHEVWVTVRGSRQDIPDLPGVDRGRILEHVDATNGELLIRAFGRAHPEAVINCVGLVKQRAASNDPLLAIETNALLPHRLADLCLTSGSRLVHVSTDCVFSGRGGNYTEESVPDADDLYGRTKLLGEVTDSHALTLRTSIIGRELRGHQGLAEWFLAQQGPVRGYTRSLFSGVTTHQFSRAVADYVLPHPELHGLYHVSGEPIAKYQLLELLKRSYRRESTIEPDHEVICDRTLDSSRFRAAIGFAPLAWPEMVEEMASDAYPYDTAIKP